MIELKNVSFAYEPSNMTSGAVHDLSFHIRRGDFCALLGSNGAGKSTVTKLMRGLLQPTGGSVVFDGQDLRAVRASTLASRIGYLFQNPDRQLCRNTIREELKFSLVSAKVDKALHEELIEAQLREFDFDGGEETATMSRGERQRAALCSALVSRPELLLLDEPTTGLDYLECRQIMECISEQNKNGVTVVMVCHDMEIVLDYAKSCVVIDAGRVCGSGTPQEVFYNSELLEKASLLPPQLIELANRFELGEKISSAEDFAALIMERRR